MGCVLWGMWLPHLHCVPISQEPAACSWVSATPGPAPTSAPQGARPRCGVSTRPCARCPYSGTSLAQRTASAWRHSRSLSPMPRSDPSSGNRAGPLGAGAPWPSNTQARGHVGPGSGPPSRHRVSWERSDRPPALPLGLARAGKCYPAYSPLPAKPPRCAWVPGPRPPPRPTSAVALAQVREAPHVAQAHAEAHAGEHVLGLVVPLGPRARLLLLDDVQLI